jgi:lysophospholipase L1-like esterase
LDTALQDHIKIGPPPNIIIIHLGANDLTTVKAKELILNIECSILRLKTLPPSIFLFWSDMLQRLYWHGAKSTVKIEKARKMMNAAARSIFLCEAGGYIRHPSISIRELSLYRKDGVHLSTTGNAIFVNDMQGDLNILYLGITKLSRGLILMRRAVIELFVWRDPGRHSKV